MSQTVLASPNQRIIFWAFVAFLALCFALGGASRADVVQTIPLRLSAVLLIACCVAVGRSPDWAAVRVPGLLLIASATITTLQLIPLPPGLWSLLPGRETAWHVAQAAGISQPWRPISLTPDLTLNSLGSLLPPAAAVAAFAFLSREDRFRTLPILLIGGAVSVVIGLVQITSHDLYLFRVTNLGYPVGLFANRNHQAALVALMLPMLGVFARSSSENARSARLRAGLALVAGLALLPFVLANGSRAGLGLALSGTTAALVLYFARDGGLVAAFRSRTALLATAGAAVLAVGLVSGAALYSRNDALTRITSANVAEDQRFRFIPEMSRMAADFFPVGSGFGSFDSVFRGYEPSEALLQAYFNHAHNDALELAIESGAMGFFVLTAFLAWWASRASHYWRDMPRDSRARRFGRLGSVVIGILFAGSLVDYPLRTPILATICFIAACWMEIEPTRKER